MLTYLISAAILICLLDGVPLVKNKQWRELGTLGFLIVAAILLLVVNKINIPSPIEVLQQLLSPIGKFVFKERG